MDIAGLLTGGATTAISGIVSTIGGGIIGLIGAKARQKHDLAMKKIDNERYKLDLADRRSERDHELLVIDKEADRAEALAKVRREEKADENQMKALIASFRQDAAKYSAGWQDKVSGTWASVIGVSLALVDFLRGSVRPAVTYASMYLLFDLWWTVRDHIFEKIATDKQFQTAVSLRTLDMIFFITGMSIGWWFGSRPSKPPRADEQKQTRKIVESTPL